MTVRAGSVAQYSSWDGTFGWGSALLLRSLIGQRTSIVNVVARLHPQQATTRDALMTLCSGGKKEPVHSDVVVKYG